MYNQENDRFIKISSFLLILIFIGLPFNGLPYDITIFGEMTFEGSFYLILISVPIFLGLLIIYKKGIILPKHYTFFLFFLFLFWILISAVFNYDEIATNFFKGRSGTSKLIGQLMVVCFSIMILLFLYNLMKLVGTKKIKKAFLYSLVLPFIYSFFEILHGLNISFATDFLLYIEKYLHSYGVWNYLLSDEFRIRSVSGEASWFATYLVFIIPWLLQYTINSKKHIYKFLLLYSLILTYFTFSRTVYFIVLIQIIVFSYFILVKSKKFDLKNIAYKILKEKKIIGYLLLVVLIVFIGIFGYKSIQIISTLFDSNNLSNVGRLSSQIAAVKMGFDNIIIGTGFGQYGFHMPEYISKEAIIKSLEIAEWVNEDPGTPWPPVHGLYARIFAETGVIGLVIWLSVWGTLIFQGIKILRMNIESDKNNVITILTVIVGTMFIGFNIDTFRVVIYYTVIAMAFVIYEEYDVPLSKKFSIK